MLIQGRIEVEVISRFDIVSSMFYQPRIEVEFNTRFDIVSSMFIRPCIEINFIQVDQCHCDRCFFDVVSRSTLLVASTSLKTGLFEVDSILLNRSLFDLQKRFIESSLQCRYKLDSRNLSRSY